MIIYCKQAEENCLQHKIGIDDKGNLDNDIIKLIQFFTSKKDY